MIASTDRLTALTKDRSLIDMYARFLKFEDEMTVISVVWREAQQFIDKYEKVLIYNLLSIVLSLICCFLINSSQF